QNPNVTVGGPGPLDGNVLAQNTWWGLVSWSAGIRVEGNHVGMVPGGDTHSFPNVNGGVLLAKGTGAVVRANTFGYQVYGPSVGMLYATGARVEANQFLAGVRAVHAEATATGTIGGTLPAQANTMIAG